MSKARDLVFASKQPSDLPKNEKWADDWTPKGWIMAISNIPFKGEGGGGGGIFPYLREALFRRSKRWISHVGSFWIQPTWTSHLQQLSYIQAIKTTHSTSFWDNFILMYLDKVIFVRCNIFIIKLSLWQSTWSKMEPSLEMNNIIPFSCDVPTMISTDFILKLSHNPFPPVTCNHN